MELSFKDWQNVDIRVGLIEKVEEIEGKDNLYNLSVDFAGEKRTAVVGIKQFYSISKLQGKKSVFVYNLAPAKIAGLDSNAMILAAKAVGGSYKILFVDNSVKEGTQLE